MLMEVCAIRQTLNEAYVGVQFGGAALPGPRNPAAISAHAVSLVQRETSIIRILIAPISPYM